MSYYFIKHSKIDFNKQEIKLTVSANNISPKHWKVVKMKPDETYSFNDLIESIFMDILKGNFKFYIKDKSLLHLAFLKTIEGKSITEFWDDLNDAKIKLFPKFLDELKNHSTPKTFHVKYKHSNRFINNIASIQNRVTGFVHSTKKQELDEIDVLYIKRTILNQVEISQVV